jgi:hypothetical protein
VVAERLDRQVVLEALLVPLIGDGSVVLVHGPVERDVLAAIATAERVDLTTGRS